MGRLDFWILLFFPNFLRSKVLNHWTTSEDQSTCRESNLYWNTVSSQNLMIRVLRNIFIHVTSLVMIQISPFCSILAQNRENYPKTFTNQSWKVSNGNFWTKPNIVLKLPRVVHVLQVCANLSMKYKSIKAIYIRLKDLIMLFQK